MVWRRKHEQDLHIMKCASHIEGKNKNKIYNINVTNVMCTYDTKVMTAMLKPQKKSENILVYMKKMSNGKL
jgi:hypothetical protein